MLQSHSRNRVARLKRSLFFLLTAVLIPIPGLAEATVAASIAASTAAGGGQLGQTSADGRFTVFTSGAALATNQIGDQHHDDVYLLDRATGRVTLVSHRFDDLQASASDDSSEPVISADGAWVAFRSEARDLVPGFVDGTVAFALEDIYLYERATGQTTLVSHAFGLPAQGADGDSQMPAISADGRFLTFLSNATDLIDGFVDVNDFSDIYVYDRVADELTLVSHATISPTKSGSFGSFGPAELSADGAFVVYSSRARNLGGFTDGNGPGRDVFLWQRATNTNTLVSHLEADPSIGGNGDSRNPSLSADGAFVAFDSEATDLLTGFADQNGTARDVYLFERATGEVTLVSHADGLPETGGAGGSAWPRLSGDGSTVAFLSSAPDLLASFVDRNGADADLFTWRRSLDTTLLVSHAAGIPATGGDGESFAPSLSADGSVIAFASLAGDLVAGFTDRNGAEAADVFVYEAGTLENTLASHADGAPATGGDAASEAPQVVSDGSLVVYESHAGDLVGGQATGVVLPNVLGFDFTNAENHFISTRSADAVSSTANEYSYLDRFISSRRKTISDDGRFTVFSSRASELVPGQDGPSGAYQVFLYDRELAVNRLISHASASEATGGNAASRRPSLSADGAFVVFESTATDLVDGFVNANGTAPDIFLWEAATGQISLVSRATAGATTGGAGRSELPELDAAGRYFIFQSNASDLVPGFVDRNGGGDDIYLFDRTTGTMTLVSRAAGTVAQGADDLTRRPRISDGGGFIVFDSRASDLVPGFIDQNGATGTDVYLFERATGTLTLVSHVPSSATTGGDARAEQPKIAGDGSFVVFESPASDLVDGFVSGDGATGSDLFHYDIASGDVTLLSHAAGQAAVGGDFGGSETAWISGNSAFVVFESHERNLVAGLSDNNGKALDIFLHEIATDTTTLISHRDGAPLETGNRGSTDPHLSADAKIIAFISKASDLLPVPIDPSLALSELYRVDRTTGTREILSHDVADPFLESHEETSTPIVSADGTSVAFTSMAADLVDGDVNDKYDVFLVAPDLAADLALTLSGIPASVDPLKTFGGTLDLSHLGVGTAPRVRVYVDLDGGTLISTSAAGWRCDAFTNAFACDLETPLASLVSAPTILFSARAPNRSGSVNVTATAVAAVPDPVPGNNTDTATIALTGNLFADGFESGDTSAWDEKLSP